MKYRIQKLIVLQLITIWYVLGWPVFSYVTNAPWIPIANAATQTFTTSGSWQAPVGVSLVVVEAWGGGGAGGGRSSTTGVSGGGGGGAYASATISVTAGNTYNYTVGATATGGKADGPNGNPSFWDTGSQVLAAGGKGGLSTTTRGVGGATADSVGTTLFKGGDGADGVGTLSGGGGGGAGSTGAGGNATLGTAGTGTSQGGGSGGAGVTNANGNPGTVAGGGGSGAQRTNGSRNGGNGAAGQIRITYGVVSISITDGAVAYGTLATNISTDTTSGGLNDTQVATNDGDTAEDFNIKGQDSANWTLAGAAGSEQYAHFFCIGGSGSPDPCDTGPTWTALTTSYSSLATNIAATGNKRFDLKLTTPTATSTTSQQSVNITVQATQH